MISNLKSANFLKRWTSSLSKPRKTSPLSNKRAYSTEVDIVRDVTGVSLTDEVINLRTHNDALFITLNRPKALNSLNMDMIHQLKEVYETASEYKRIFINGVGKAFCAGGDVREIYGKGKSEKKDRVSFFAQEYEVNRKIGELEIPHIAILDGITMGGGAGISVHGSIRIATERTVFAMPEARIGFFCDVGGTYFLPRLNKRMGYYLGLTAQSIKGVDVYKSGVATHFILSKYIPNLVYLLGKIPKEAESELTSLIDVYHKISMMEKHDSVVDKYGDMIEQVFQSDDIEEIIDVTSNSMHTFFKEAGKAMKGNSPLSMKVIKESLDRGAKLSFSEAFAQELKIANNFMNNDDFYEGVRAQLVDKDRNPKWNPKSLREVKQETVESFFK